MAIPSRPMESGEEEEDGNEVKDDEEGPRPGLGVPAGRPPAAPPRSHRSYLLRYPGAMRVWYAAETATKAASGSDPPSVRPWPWARAAAPAPSSP